MIVNDIGPSQDKLVEICVNSWIGNDCMCSTLMLYLVIKV